MTQTEQRNSARAFYDELDPVCRAGLLASLNPQTHLWDRQLMDKRWQSTGECYPTEDLTSTAICLIGVSRAGVEPGEIGLDVPRTLDAMIALCAQKQYAGGFGLVAWANAVCGGESLDELQQRCGVSIGSIGEHLAPLTTMEAAWLASGLAHEFKRTGDDATRALLDGCAAELIERRYQPQHKVVCHAGPGGGGGHALRRWIANFADQIYTVQALSFASIVKGGDERARTVAAAIGGKMVAYQGGLGQWWWHYDAKRGGVPQAYSVYSVHQHGMAPMALYALRAAGGAEYEQAIALSRAWIDKNELGESMVCHETPTIWRSIEYAGARLGEKMRKAKSLFGLAGDQSRAAPPALRMNRETRPYEWAWCLYAGAIERGVDAGGHVV